MRPTTLERAFELAESGEYSTTVGLAKALKKEGYVGVDPLIAQDAVRRRLRQAIMEARERLVGIIIEDASVDVSAFIPPARAKALIDDRHLGRSPNMGAGRTFGE